MAGTICNLYGRASSFEMTHGEYLDKAVRLAMASAASGEGGPFGAVIVRDGRIIGAGTNRVTSELDPTAHAEVMAIRDACRNLGSFRLDGSVLYASCMPCPMCYAAIYWARIERVFYAADAGRASESGFDDRRIAFTLGQPPAERAVPCLQIEHPLAERPFQLWEATPGRTEY